MKYIQIALQGGPIMYVIILCALIAAYIFFLKWFQYYRAQVSVDEIVTGLINVLGRDGMIEAMTLCDNTPGPVARLLASGINAYRNGDDIKEALEAQSLIEVPRLESRLNILATIAYVAPLLGLLGTVIGMVDSFQVMEASASGSSASIPELSHGVYKALMCTAAGLSIAIPCHIGYNYLLARVQDFCLDMEKASAEIMYFFHHHARSEHEN